MSRRSKRESKEAKKEVSTRRKWISTLIRGRSRITWTLAIRSSTRSTQTSSRDSSLNSRIDMPSSSSSCSSTLQIPLGKTLRIRCQTEGTHSNSTPIRGRSNSTQMATITIGKDPNSLTNKLIIRTSKSRRSIRKRTNSTTTSSKIDPSLTLTKLIRTKVRWMVATSQFPSTKAKLCNRTSSNISLFR